MLYLIKEMWYVTWYQIRLFETGFVAYLLQVSKTSGDIVNNYECVKRFKSKHIVILSALVACWCLYLMA